MYVLILQCNITVNLRDVVAELLLTESFTMDTCKKNRSVYARAITHLQPCCVTPHTRVYRYMHVPTRTCTLAV